MGEITGSGQLNVLSLTSAIGREIENTVPEIRVVESIGVQKCYVEEKCSFHTLVSFRNN